MRTWKAKQSWITGNSASLRARFLRTTIVSMLLLFCGAVAGVAQIDTGSLGGTVSDATGSVIAGAQVMATETQSGTVYRTVTSSSGAYVFGSLRPGIYNVSATSASFAGAQITGLPIYVSTRAAHDFTLAAGSTTETVEVNAGAPTLETESSDIGTVITPKQVEQLPLTAGGAVRSLSTFIFLAPGAVGPGTNGGQVYTKIGGGQTEGSDILLDGLSTLRSENGSGQIDQDTPNPEAVEEFRVETFSLPAYFGRTTGGIANFKTRAGTNTYHGSIYDYFKNKIFDANNYFNKGNAGLNGVTQDYDPKAQFNPYRRPTDTHNDFGATLGGAVRVPHIYNGQDKTFFFFNFNQVPNSFGHSVTSYVPTAAQRGTANGGNGSIGDFSSLLGGPIPLAGGGFEINPCTGQQVLYNQIFDPATTKTVTSGGNTYECRTPFANNQVPIGRSGVTSKVLSYIPLPNATAAGNGNYVYQYNEKVVQTVFSLRLDQNFGTRNHLFAFGSARENFDSSAPNFPGPINSGNQQQDLYTKYARIGWDFTLTPHLVNQITFGGNRIDSYNASPVSYQGTNWDALLGIPNTPGAGTTFPTFSLGEGLAGLGQANYDRNVDNGLIVDDNVSWQKGRHTVRVGGTYRWQQFSYINSGPAAGNFGFSRAETSADNVDTTVQSASGNSFASFLLGSTSNENRTVQLHAPRWIQTYFATYVQDDLKMRPNLTLNLGFRYSIDTPRHEASGNIASWDPTVPNAAANGILGALKFGGVGTGRDGNKNEAFAQTYYKNFEPRVGFAYAPAWLDNKTVLRGAYTIMYGGVVYSDYGQGLNQGFTVSNTNNPDPYIGPGQIDAGPTNVPTAPNLDPTQRNGGGNGADYVMAGDGKPGMVQNYSMEVQQQLLPDMTLTVGFLGNHATRLRSLVYWPNSLNPAYFALGNLLTQPLNSTAAQSAGIPTPFANFYTVNGGGSLVGQALLPFPQTGYLNNDSYLQNRGQSTYDALEVKLDRKFRNGLNLLLSYTWSKTLTDADSIQPFFATVLGQGGTQNPYNLKAEKAVSTQDVPTNFVVSYLYELPVGRGKKFLSSSNKVVNALVGGYRIGGIDRYLSGQPISFFGAAGVPYFDGGIRYSYNPGQDFLSPAAKSGHYNVFAFQTNNNPTTVNQTSFFNRNAFIDQNSAQIRGSGPYRFGNLPRNMANVRTAAYFNEDANINKHFTLRGEIGADLRFEVFNILNRHVFGKPDTGVGDTTFGQITGLNDGPRSAQLVLKVQF